MTFGVTVLTQCHIVALHIFHSPIGHVALFFVAIFDISDVTVSHCHSVSKCVTV
jgi:hypothetical protein